MIAFIDLEAQYRALQRQIDKAALCVFTEGKYILGPQVRRLETSLAEYVGTRNCVSCANGTDALALLMMAYEIGPGDAVFVPSFTFFATAEVVRLRGAEPVFVDVCENTFSIDIVCLEYEIRRVCEEGRLVPRAVIPVDLFGLPANYDLIAEVAHRYGLLVFEDGAQGMGGEFCKRRACGFGDASATSFFPSKPIGCYGDGGALFTNDDSLAKLLRSLRAHGRGEEKYNNVRIGLNSRLDTVQAAILQVKLEAFKETEMELRQVVAARYNSALQNIYAIPFIPENYLSSYAQYTLTLADEAEREALREHLRAVGVPSMIYYPRPLNLQEAFLDLPPAKCPISESLSSRVLSIPMHPYLSFKEQDYIIESLLRFRDIYNK